MRVHIILSFTEVFLSKYQPGAINQEREMVNSSNYFHWLTVACIDWFFCDYRPSCRQARRARTVWCLIRSDTTRHEQLICRHRISKNITKHYKKRSDPGADPGLEPHQYGYRISWKLKKTRPRVSVGVWERRGWGGRGRGGRGRITSLPNM